MSKLQWNQTGDRLYETGIRKGVLYLRDAQGAYPQGVPWNGLTSVSENPTGAEVTPLYADNIKYVNLMSVEEFEATINAFTYPDEFAQCDGSAALEDGVYIGQQSRSTFGMVYVTNVGNDVDLEDHGYKIHIIYGALASPSEKSYETINDSPEGIEFSWDITTTPVEVTDHRPTASMVIDSTKVDAADLQDLEDALFGTETEEAYLPLPDAIKAMFAA